MTTAIYPSAIRTYTDHQDYVEIVDATHVNALQAEVTAIEKTLGVQPGIYAPVGSKATTYSSVGARMDAHETALAAQQAQINTLLAASKIGWATPALTVSGYVNPAVRLMPVTGFIDPGPTSVAWTSETVNVGDMFVPNANTVAIPLGGLWSIHVSITNPIDWTTLGSVQSVYNNLRIAPIPIAFQRLAASIWVQGVQVAYGPDTVHWLPIAQQPNVVLSGGNPPTQHQLTGVCSFLGPLTTGSQVQVKAEQFYGAMTGAHVTCAFKYERAIQGVN